MEGGGEVDAAESAHESASHFAAWAMVSAPLVLGFDLTNRTRLGLAWLVNPSRVRLLRSFPMLAFSTVYRSEHEVEIY